MKTATGFWLWFLRWSGARAITLPTGRILCVPGSENDAELLAHEEVHLWQIEMDGPVEWLFKVVYYLIRYGYKDSPYEVEARRIAGI